MSRSNQLSVPSSESLAAANRAVRGFTVAAMATGAIPVPGASAAIVAENAAMIATIASQLGVPVDVATVAKTLGLAGSANMLGRAVFVEGAGLIGWASGPFGLAGLSALGATTAGIQTWVVGRLAIEIARNTGAALTLGESRRAVRDAKAEFEAWRTDDCG